MKKLLLLIMALVLLSALGGCGKKDAQVVEAQPVPVNPYSTPVSESVQEGAPVTAADPSAEAPVELISYVCYEDFPQIPDFGSVNGYELYQALTGEGGAMLYYYQSRYGDDDLKAEFWYDAARYSQAVKQQGFASQEMAYGDVLLRYEQCGEYKLALYTVSRQDNEGVFSAKENLLLLVVKPVQPEQ